MTSLTKKPHPQAKNFFRVQSTRLADPFEPLNISSAMGGGARALARQLKTAVFLRKSPKPGGSKSVKGIRKSDD